MMKIKWQKDALYDVRRLPTVVDMLEGIARGIAERANDTAGLGDGGYMTGSRQGARRPYGRWRTSVVTASAAAMIDNGENNTLLRSMR